MARYAGSTQSTHWLMSHAEVLQSRRLAVEAHQNLEGVLSLDDEAVIRRHHELRILRLTARIGFPDKVAASAISYFKRFFLHRSVLDFNPSIIALSALYASFKVEEVLMSADDLVSRADVILNGIHASPDDVTGSVGAPSNSVDGTACRVASDVLLSTELSFLHSIKFHLICYHPYRCLFVLRERLANDASLPTLAEYSRSEAHANDDDSSSPLSSLMVQATRIVTRRTLLTDVQFTHSPAAIAIASLVAAAFEICQVEGKVAEALDPDAIQARLLQDIDEDGSTVIIDLVCQIRQMVEGGVEASVVRQLEVRRQALRNPLNDPMSIEYQKVDEQKQSELHEKRRRKALDHKEKLRRETAALIGFEDPAGACGDGLMQ
jgi:Cyclin, N-terminal domain